MTAPTNRCWRCDRDVTVKRWSGRFIAHTTGSSARLCPGSGERSPAIVIHSAEGKSRVKSSRKAHESADRAGRWALEQSKQRRPRQIDHP